MTDPQAARNTIVFLAIVVEGGLVGLALLLGWLLDHPPLDEHFGQDPESLFWGLAGCVPMLMAFLAMKRWPIGPFRAIEEFTDRVIRPAMAPCTLLDLFGISCLAGLGEEMLFRGVLQSALASYLSPWWGLVLASLLFGLVHAATAGYAVLAALMGVYLGGLYLMTGDLLAPIVAHALYDFIVLVAVLRSPEEGVEDEEEEEQDFEEEDEDE